MTIVSWVGAVKLLFIVLVLLPYGSYRLGQWLKLWK